MAWLESFGVVLSSKKNPSRQRDLRGLKSLLRMSHRLSKRFKQRLISNHMMTRMTPSLKTLSVCQ